MNKESNKTHLDLLRFCRSQARFNMSNYNKESYRLDNNARRNARKAADKVAGIYHGSGSLGSLPLICGKYFGTRLIITEDKIEYIPGQYAPTEIYWAMEDYYRTTRGLR